PINGPGVKRDQCLPFLDAAGGGHGVGYGDRCSVALRQPALQVQGDLHHAGRLEHALKSGGLARRGGGIPGWRAAPRERNKEKRRYESRVHGWSLSRVHGWSLESRTFVSCAGAHHRRRPVWRSKFSVWSPDLTSTVRKGVWFGSVYIAGTRFFFGFWS